MEKVYGVDPAKKVTPLMVRGALVMCFNEAHCSQVGLVGMGDAATTDYCIQIVKKAFDETGGDYNNPTKDSLTAVLPWLADFSKSFRNQEVIKKHMNEILGLIKLI